MVNKIIHAFMAAFFRLLYHQFAWSYDLVAAIVSFGKWQDWVRSISDQLKPIPTLEIGFGPGHLQHHLSSLNYPIYGLDLSPQMCRIAVRRSKAAALVPKIACASSTAIPFPDHSFGQVVATFPSEYILFSGTLSEISRVLKPGGKLAILAMARITGKSLPHRIMAAIYRITGQTVDLERNSLEKMLQPFTRLGFQITLDEIALQNATLTFLTATLPE